MDVARAKEIVVSAHEAAHAVASVRLGLAFEYVTLDDADIGPHVQHIDNLPRPIVFYRGGGSCCDPNRPICNACRAEQDRAESYIMVAICGTLGVHATGCDVFGYGHDADKAYVIDFCRTAFGDRTDAEIDARMKAMLQKAAELMHPEGRAASAVAKALRTRRRLTEADVKEIMRDASE
jgi:hypothetical protein